MKAWSEKNAKRQAWIRHEGPCWENGSCRFLKPGNPSVRKRKMAVSVCRPCLCFSGPVKAECWCHMSLPWLSETGPSESDSILTLTESGKTGSPVHWPIQNQSCHIMSLRSWRSSWCWRSPAPIGTKSCCVCWPGSRVCNCSMGTEWASMKMMFKLSPRPQWCRSLLLQGRNRLCKNEANGKLGEHLYLQTVN